VKKRKVYLISACRSTIAPTGGCLKNVNVPQLAATVLNQCLARIKTPKALVEDVLISNALGGGGNLARLCVLEAGFSNRILGTSVDRQCVGGLDAILQAAQHIKNGQADLLIAGGVESFSLRPERHYRPFWKASAQSLDRPPFFPEDSPTHSLGTFIKALKEEYCISDEEEFLWTQNSHKKALKYKSKGLTETTQITKKDAFDPYSRKISQHIFNKSKARFGNEHPCNTAPNADGAAFVVLASEQTMKHINCIKAIQIEDGFTMGGSPEKFPTLPAEAMRKILDQNQLTWKQIAQIELMEAYAVQAILCAKWSTAPVHKINPHGGALSRGHPIGASGAILVVHLFHSLQKNQRGLAAIAGAGGLASVLLLKS